MEEFMGKKQRKIWLGIGILAILLTAIGVVLGQMKQALRLQQSLKSAREYCLDCGILPLRQGGERQIELVVSEEAPAERMLLVLRETQGALQSNHDAFGEMTRRQRELGQLAGRVRVLTQDGDLLQDCALELRQGRADRKARGIVLAVLHSLPKGRYQLQIEITAPAPNSIQSGASALFYDIGYLTYLPLGKRWAEVLIFGLLALLLGYLLLTQSISRSRRRQREEWLAEGIGRDKVIYLLTAYPLWSETFLRQDLRLLLAEGVPLEPLALFPGDGECQPDWPAVRLLSSVKPGTSAASASWGRFLPGHLRAILSLWRHRRLLRQLQAEIYSLHSRHIHAEFADLGALLAVVAARRCGISFSLGIHARDVHAQKYPLKLLCRGVSFVTTCNRAAGAALIKQMPRIAPKMHLIYHGLELADWPFREQEPVAAPLLFVGRFSPKKGLPILLQALSRLQKAGERCELVVLGSGPAEAEFKVLAESLGLAEKVHWLGVLPRSAVAAQLSRVEAICVPSVVARDGDQEGIPNVVVEAMACGVPVVAGMTGGIAEILNSDTGWPLEEVTPEAIQAAILALRSQAAERDRRRRLARQRVEADFDAAQLVKRRKNLFRL